MKENENDTCCEDFLHVSSTNETCCRGTLIKNSQKLCCETKVISKNNANDECCGDEILHEGKMCCNGAQRDKFAEGETLNMNTCCGEDVILGNETSQVCCQDTIHTTSNSSHQCCGRSLIYSNDTDQVCCGDSVHTSTNSSDECCGDDLILSTESHRSCCNGQAIDLNIQGCCGTKGHYDLENACCFSGNTLYNASLFNGFEIVLKTPGLKKCCGGLPYNDSVIDGKTDLCCDETLYRQVNETDKCCKVALGNVLKRDKHCCGVPSDSFWENWMANNWLAKNYTDMFRELECPSICPDGFALYSTDRCYM